MNCHNCNAPLKDGASFCTSCGTPVAPAQTANQNQQQYQQPQQYQQQYQQPQYQPQPNPYDHTEEFSVEEVKDGKLLAMLCYLFSIIGAVIVIIANINKKSSYLDFHIKQSIKLAVCYGITAFVAAVLCWTCIVPIAAAAAYIIITVADVYCFILTAMGKSFEPLLIRGIGFLK